MKVINIHERILGATFEQVGALIDSLASEDDALWPHHVWPAMKFDRPLAVGAAGGHGPIGYFVEEYIPGQSVRFRFTKPEGWDGTHRFEVVNSPEGTVSLRHTLDMATSGSSSFAWQLIYRPMHDAVFEDVLGKAQASLGQTPQMKPWSGTVKFLRWILAKGNPRPQIPPEVKQGEWSLRQAQAREVDNGK